MSRAWAKQAERSSPLMLHIIRWIALYLGRTPARAILYPITFYFLIFAPRARRASYNYLRCVSGQRVHVWHVAKHIFFFAATILDRVFLLSGKQHNLNITLHNEELILDNLNSATGCILLGSHLGSFEVLRALAVDQKLPLKILMQEVHNENITRILHSLNENIADTVIPLGKPEALFEAQKYLQQGYSIGILGDRVTDSRKTTTCEFLCGKAAFPTGPMLAASILKGPVILFFGLYLGGRNYDVYFEKFTNQVTIDQARRDFGLQTWTQTYADRLAYYARLSPYNWFNFYDFWETDS